MTQNADSGRVIEPAGRRAGKESPMKVRQYVMFEKAIVGADTGGIWERWHYGGRLAVDPEYIANGNGGGLQHGAADRLIEAAARAGLKLNQQEIQRRLRCARTYPTEGQMRIVTTRFGTWSELVQAGFPAIDADPDEPPADHRTKAERDHERAQQMLLAVGQQGSLFEDFDPDEATLKDLFLYAEEQRAITERFVAQDRKRQSYLRDLSAAVNYDLSKKWQEAHRAAFGEDVS